jgi:lysozyme
MFEHHPNNTENAEPAPHAYTERAPYHQHGLLIRILTGGSGLLLAVVVSLTIGTYVGSQKPHWFVTVIEEVASEEERVDTEINADANSPQATATSANTAAAPVLPPPTRTCAASSVDGTGFTLGGPVGSDAIGVFVSKPEAAMAWADVRKASVSFAYVSATDGRSSKEAHFPENWSLIRECGMLRGAVHRYRSAKGIEDQGRNFVSVLSGDMGELPPAIALDGQHRSRRDCESYIEGLVELSQIIEDQLSIPPVILTSASFWNDTLKCTTDSFTDQRARSLSAYPLWLREDDGTAPPPGHWHRADFTDTNQTASLGKSKLHIETYNGSENQLVSWVTGLRK